VGSVSIGGSTGRNIAPVVDGADNRDNLVGGPMMSFTLEGTEEFRVNTHQFSASDGRSGGSSVVLLTKSGTNEPRGSAFLYGRDRALTKRDYFAARDNIPEDPFWRTQFGGSLGGPIVRNRAFYFGAVEFVREEKSMTIPDSIYNEVALLRDAGFPVLPAHTIPQPYRDRMYTLKVNEQINSKHSLMGRYAGQKHTAFDGIKTPRFMSDLSSMNIEETSYWSALGQHNWVASSRILNQLTVHRNQMIGVSDYTGSKGPGQDPSLYFHTHYPDVQRLPAMNNLTFPGFSVGMPTTPYNYAQKLWQIKDDLTLQFGTHTLKMGGDHSWLPLFGGGCCLYWGRLNFFNDPSTIAFNTNGLYPQGFQTPGILARWSEGADLRTNGVPLSGRKYSAYFQDDWRVGSRLTLNLGVRYDRDVNFYDQEGIADNLTYQVLKAIDSPYGRFPHTPTKDISPRVGFAYDISGNGKRVLRGGYGLYFDGTGTNTHYNIFIQNHRPLTFEATRTNTAIGVGELADFRLGIDPLPDRPTDTGNFPRGKRSGGYWFDPNISDPRTHQVHVGYTQQLGASTALSIDYSHVQQPNDFRALEINPIIDGTRRLAPTLAAVLGDPDLIGPLQIQAAMNKNRYDEMAVVLERRMRRATVRATYVLSGAYAYAGQIAGSAYFVPPPAQWDDPNARSEWGPTNNDERHRVVLFGVFELPYGLQLSPVFRAASARPYNLILGRDLNGDQYLNERYVDPATGQPVSINSAKGDSLSLLDVRATKFFTLRGQERRRIGVFAEVFNVFNTANFGDQFQGNSRSGVFQQPIGFLGVSLGHSTYPLTLQLGGRLEF
jgi:hypothetical protein